MCKTVLQFLHFSCFLFWQAVVSVDAVRKSYIYARKLVKNKRIRWQWGFHEVKTSAQVWFVQTVSRGKVRISAYMLLKLQWFLILVLTGGRSKTCHKNKKKTKKMTGPMTVYDNWIDWLWHHPLEMVYFQLLPNKVNSVVIFCDIVAAVLVPDDIS